MSITVDITLVEGIPHFCFAQHFCLIEGGRDKLLIADLVVLSRIECPHILLPIHLLEVCLCHMSLHTFFQFVLVNLSIIVGVNFKENTFDFL